jgi:hypothetical protein
LSSPHLSAVERYECTTARSVSPPRCASTHPRRGAAATRPRERRRPDHQVRPARPPWRRRPRRAHGPPCGQRSPPAPPTRATATAAGSPTPEPPRVPAPPGPGPLRSASRHGRTLAGRRWHPRARVVGRLRLEQPQCPLGAVGGPGGQHPPVVLAQRQCAWLAAHTQHCPIGRPSRARAALLRGLWGGRSHEELLDQADAVVLDQGPKPPSLGSVAPPSRSRGPSGPCAVAPLRGLHRA